MTDDHSATVPATLAQESDDDGGLSIEAVVAAQGISKDAVRRRLRSGKLAGHQRPSRYGQVWCIHLDGQIHELPQLRQSSATVAGDERHSGATVAPTSAQPADVAALVGIINRLTVENGELRTEANGWKSQALMFALQLTEAQERLAITAPADSPVAAQPEREPAPAPVGGVTRTVLALLVAVAGGRGANRERRYAVLAEVSIGCLAIVLALGVALTFALVVTWLASLGWLS